MLRKRPFLNLYRVGRGKEGRVEYRLYPLTMLPLASCPFQLGPCPGRSQSRVRAAPRVSPPALSARRKTGRRSPAHGPPGLGGALGRPGRRHPGKGGGPLRPALGVPCLRNGGPTFTGPTREPGLSEAKKRLTYVPSKQRAAHPAVKSREQAAPLRVPAVPPTLGPRMAHGWAGGSQSLGADTRRRATRWGEPRGCR